MRRGPGGFEGPGRGLEALDLTDEQKEAIKALHEKIKADLEAGMAEILTEEQLARLEEIKERTGGPWGPGHPGAGPLGVLRGLELTEDQQAEVKTIMEAAKEKLEAAETPEARKAAFEAAIDEVKELLTPEQLEQLEKALPRFKERPGGPLGGGILACAEQIGLTDEQITQIKAIEEQTRAAVDAAETIEARHEALQDGREAVEKVLTAEQLEKLKECMAQQRPGRGEGRRPGGYRGPRPGGGPGGFRPGRRG